jgi:hypothetical protein
MSFGQPVQPDVSISASPSAQPNILNYNRPAHSAQQPQFSQPIQPSDISSASPFSPTISVRSASQPIQPYILYRLAHSNSSRNYITVLLIIMN